MAVVNRRALDAAHLLERINDGSDPCQRSGPQRDAASTRTTAVLNISLVGRGPAGSSSRVPRCPRSIHGPCTTVVRGEARRCGALRGGRHPAATVVLARCSYSARQRQLCTPLAPLDLINDARTLLYRAPIRVVGPLQSASQRPTLSAAVAEPFLTPSTPGRATAEVARTQRQSYASRCASSWPQRLAHGFGSSYGLPPERGAGIELAPVVSGDATLRRPPWQVRAANRDQAAHTVVLAARHDQRVAPKGSSAQVS